MFMMINVSGSLHLQLPRKCAQLPREKAVVRGAGRHFVWIHRLVIRKL